MGGQGSGNRWRSSRRIEAEECLRLTVHDLKRLGLLDGQGVTSGSIEWSHVGTGRILGRAFYSIAYRHDRALSLTIEHAGEPFSRRVRFVTSAMPTNAERPWFACPKCSRRVGVLYVPPGYASLACRLCLRLTYRSSNQSHAFDRMFARLGAELGMDPDDVRNLLSDGDYSSR